MKALSILAAVFYLCGCSPEHKHSEACSHGAAQKTDTHEHSASCSPAEEKPAHADEHGQGESGNPADKKESNEHGHDEASASPTNAPQWLSVNEESQKLLGMTFGKTEMRALEGLVRLQGRLRPTPGSETALFVPVSGTLCILVLPGAEVKAGSPLFTVEAPELGQLSVRNEKLKAETVRVAAELSALDRRLQVYREGGNRNAELETLKAAKEAERKTVMLEQEMFKAEESRITRMGILEGSRLTITAPTDGTVRLQATLGCGWGEKGMDVLTLQTGRAFICEARATSRQTEGLTNGLPVTLTRPGKDPVRGLSLARGGNFDEATLTCALYASVTNPPAWFYSGLPVTMEIQTTAGEADTVIPANAWFLENGKSMVFVRHPQDPSKFARREVEVHVTVDGYSSVCGVAEGESVMLEGAYELRYQFPVGTAADTVKKAGHFHADGAYHEKGHK